MPPSANSFLLFLLVLACHNGATAKGMKQKRLVIDLSDPLLTVTDPSTVYFPPRPTTTTAYSSSPSFYSPPRSAFASYAHRQAVSPLKPASLFDGNLFQYSNYGSPFPFLSGNHLSLDGGEETYIADGRILKQYAVMEFHAEERDRDQHHQQLLQQSSAAFRTPSGTPYPPAPYFNKFPTSFDPLYGPTFPQLPQLPSFSTSFNPRFGVQHTDQQRSPLLTKNHGPIALGSGSLGYIHGPNGVTVGSGSLGYISHQQHRETLAELIERKKSKHLPSPLTFGHNHD